MKTWSITEARARIASVFDAAIVEGPQRIVRRGGEKVVMAAESDWDRLVAEYPDIANLFLKAPIDADDLPKRRPARILAESDR